MCLSLSRLPHTLAPSPLSESLEQASRHTIHATLQAVGKERRLLVVLFAALDCTGFVRITMFATAKNCFFRLAFLWDHLTAMSYLLFRS